MDKKAVPVDKDDRERWFAEIAIAEKDQLAKHLFCYGVFLLVMFLFSLLLWILGFRQQPAFALGDKARIIIGWLALTSSLISGFMALLMGYVYWKTKKHAALLRTAYSKKYPC